MTRLLVVEDDAAIRRGLVDLLRSEQYTVDEAEDGPSGLEKILTDPPDLVLLDIMMPGMDGFDVLKAVRADNLDVPVIFLSARSQEIDKVLGFRLGADDYVIKPFGSQELLARVSARLRNPRETVLRQHAFGNVVLDRVGSRILVNGHDVPATAREKDLLAYLVRHPGEALSRQRLLNEVWGPDNMSTSRTVDSHILTLRKKIEPDPAHPIHIISVRNIGYRFEKGS